MLRNLKENLNASIRLVEEYDIYQINRKWIRCIKYSFELQPIKSQKFYHKIAANNHHYDE